MAGCKKLPKKKYSTSRTGQGEERLRLHMSRIQTKGDKIDLFPGCS